MNRFDMASAASYDVPVLLFGHEHRQAYLQTNNDSWPSCWLPSMGGFTATLPPYPGSDFSPEFAAYVQFLREEHLVFLEQDIYWSYVDIEEEEALVHASIKDHSDACCTYDHLCLRLPGYISSETEYWTQPGLILLEGMLYTSTSLEIEEL